MWTKLTHGRDEAKNNQRMGRKPKGLLQVLWGQGWIDVMKLNHYTMDGMQDAFGVVSKKFSLKTIMDSCLDFKQEETLLQSMGWSRGALVNRTPKCHCKLAREGIKYSWGCSKNMYQWVTLSKKGKKFSDDWCDSVCQEFFFESRADKNVFTMRSSLQLCISLALATATTKWCKQWASRWWWQ